MRSFVSFMNRLRFPLSPFAKDVLSFEKVKKDSGSHDPNVMKLLPHLDLDHYGFLRASNPKTYSIKKVGVVLSGGQASGGHNVIWGLYEGLKQLNSNIELVGFLQGPSGIVDNRYIKLDDAKLSEYYNTGGFDLIGSGRTKIETPEQLEKSVDTITNHNLDALVVIGGDDSNTNAAVLANYFKSHNISCQIIGVPKTVDGDLKNLFVETTFGFDTASKLYAELTSNILRDCLSAKKYYHFIKIMGRSASHLALEVALLAKPNMTLVIEEIIEHKKTLLDICHEIKQMVIKRDTMGKSFGAIVIPEGLIEAVKDVKELIDELNALDKTASKPDVSKLSGQSQKLLELFPEDVKKQLFLDLDPHGNVQVSLIETEKLVAFIVSGLLKKEGFKGKFQSVCHFFGYEGRSCFPSYFDAVYSYHLGIGASICIKEHLSGFMVGIKHLDKQPEHWSLYALSIASLMHMETRKGKLKPVIKKALVNLTSHRYQTFMAKQEAMKWDDLYEFLGPNQYQGSFEDLYQPPLLIKDQS